MAEAKRQCLTVKGKVGVSTTQQQGPAGNQNTLDRKDRSRSRLIMVSWGVYRAISLLGHCVTHTARNTLGVVQTTRTRITKWRITALHPVFRLNSVHRPEAPERQGTGSSERGPHTMATQTHYVPPSLPQRDACTL